MNYSSITMAGQRKSAMAALLLALLLNSNLDQCSSLLPTTTHTTPTRRFTHSSQSTRSFANLASTLASSTTHLLNSNDQQEELTRTAPDATIAHKSSTRTKILKLFGRNKATTPVTDESKPIKYEVTTVEELNDYFNDVQRRFRKKGDTDGDNIDYDTLLASLSVKGDTQLIGSVDHKDVIHPVVQLVHERRRQIEKIKAGKTGEHVVQTSDDIGSRRVSRTLPPEDGCRVALAIEGGGMRGCVTAGMVTAIHYLGLEDTVDVVYGSSAGTVIGAYFITRQLPWFGPEVYYDSLTTAGNKFINTKRFLRAVGLGLLDPRLTKDVIFRRNHGKPVLDLSFLLKTTMQEQKPLDWDTFVKMQEVQPLKVMASGLKSQKAIVMDMKRGSFNTIQELAACMQASCLLPGVAGPVMNLRRDNTTSLEDDNMFDMFARNKVKDDDYEPMADALLFQPLPFHTAVAEGATHVICLRSRPDGVDVTGKSSFFERLIVRRFFMRKNKLKDAYLYMRRHLHKKRYAEDVILLNEGANDVNRKYTDTTKPHLLPIAVPPGSDEVTRLETGREAILKGVRRGFARAYDALVEDIEQRGQGTVLAMKLFPDVILEYDPLEYTSTHQSAYESYKQQLRAKEELSNST
ncbi:hypothetical protein ACHAWO_008841 [Cyclotella atomus]|uniref:PNPLA domain-containing protein n=1 Tax=Cyclotella atomus TaxID=382360 RepID=A0ABD3NN25_9STRA